VSLFSFASGERAAQSGDCANLAVWTTHLLLRERKKDRATLGRLPNDSSVTGLNKLPLPA